MSAADTRPAVDVTTLRRERDVAVAALRRVYTSGTLADARHFAQRALLAMSGATLVETPRAPLEMDDALRAQLDRAARDTADLHDPTEVAR